MGPEKRGHERHAIHEEISYTVDNRTYSSETIDIGMGGIKFGTEQLLPPLTPTTIVLKKSPEVVFVGVVMWSGRIDSRYTAAMKFDNLSRLQRQQLMRFL